MNTVILPSERNNQLLNTLHVTFELVSIPVLLLSFFDLELVDLRGPMNALSYPITALLILLRWKDCLRVAKKDVSLVLIVSLVMLSVLWSAAPGATSDTTKAVLRASLIGVYLAARLSPQLLMRVLASIYGFTAVVSLLVGVAFPAVAVAFTNGEQSWKGILTHKQYLGRMMIHATWLFLLNVVGGKRFRLISWALLLLSVLLLLLSKSKTAWVAGCAVPFLVPLFYFVRWPYRPRTVVYTIAGMLGIGISALLLLNWQTIVVDVLQKPSDLNGRLPVWFLVIGKALQRPWLGYGYSGFWPSPHGRQIFSFTWASGGQIADSGSFHSHNGFLEVFVQLGAIGLGLLILNFSLTLLRTVYLIHATRSLESIWMLGTLVLILILNFPETLTLISLHSIWAIYVAIDLMSIIWKEQLAQMNSLPVT
jgi:exopolysaccharide production protein ExoQ